MYKQNSKQTKANAIPMHLPAAAHDPNTTSSKTRPIKPPIVQILWWIIGHWITNESTEIATYHITTKRTVFLLEKIGKWSHAALIGTGTWRRKFSYWVIIAVLFSTLLLWRTHSRCTWWDIQGVVETGEAMEQSEERFAELSVEFLWPSVCDRDYRVRSSREIW